MQKLPNVAPSQQHLTSTFADSEAQREKMTQVAELAKVLLGCYRTGDANEPEIYSGGVIAVLSEYPAEVVRKVVDPRRGLPARCKWLPSIAEIKEALEAEMAPIRRQREWEASEARRRAQLEQTEEWNRTRFLPPSAPRQRQYTYAEALEMGHARPIGRFEDEKRTTREPEKRISEYQGYANWLAYMKACREAGVDPASGVSPMLRDVLKRQSAPAQEAAE